jgi:hypothetical protein
VKLSNTATEQIASEKGGAKSYLIRDMRVRNLLVEAIGDADMRVIVVERCLSWRAHSLCSKGLESSNLIKQVSYKVKLNQHMCDV